jgi:hypothetical protein
VAAPNRRWLARSGDLDLCNGGDLAQIVSASCDHQPSTREAEKGGSALNELERQDEQDTDAEFDDREDDPRVTAILARQNVRERIASGMPVR